MKFVKIISGNVIYAVKLSTPVGAFDANEPNVQPPDGWSLVQNDVEVDSADVDTGVPDSVSMMNAQLVLQNKGLLSQINALISQMPEEAQIKWDKATVIHRNEPLVGQLAQVLQWTDADLDELFLAAAQIG